MLPKGVWRGVFLLILAFSLGGRDQRPPESQTMGLIDRLQNGRLSGELFSLPHGVNEFDLVYDGGAYHWVYTVYAAGFTATVHYRTAATVEGLEAAADTVILSAAGGHASTAVPTIQHIGSTWHVWAGSTSGGSTPVRHYTASAASGPYTLADEVAYGAIGDPNVRYRAADGYWYMVVTDTSSDPIWQVAILRSASPSGPWDNMGAPTSIVGRTDFDSIVQADPSIVFIGSKVYMFYAGYDGTVTKVGCFEINPVTWKATTTGIMLVEATQPWQMPNGAERVQDPIWVPEDGRLYYEANAGYAGAWYNVSAGWGYLAPERLPLLSSGGQLLRAPGGCVQKPTT